MAFLVGAVASIVLLARKIKKSNEYIPFGPFIVISVIVSMIVPEQILFDSLWFVFSGQWFLRLR